jgi:hypothetical protein
VTAAGLPASGDAVPRTERWFVDQGVPNLIAGYGLRTHVVPRARPFLVAAAIVTATSAVAYALSHHLAWWGWLLTALVAMAGYGLLAVVSLAATHYGVVALAVQATGHARADMRRSLRLQGLALPTLLFVTFFLFFTSELWQLMDHLSWTRLCLVLALFAAVTVLATSARLRAEVERIEHDLTPERLGEACAGTPLDGRGPGSTRLPAAVNVPPPLTNRQETNLLLVLATRQLVQAAVVGLGLFAFFVVFGAIVMTGPVASSWIGHEPQPSVVLPWLPVALLRAAALLAGFASMYFAITTMTQTEHRQAFFAPVVGDLERLLAVRAVYLDLLANPAPPPRR